MTNRAIFPFLALAACLFVDASAQDAPTITVRKGDRVTLSVAPLGGPSGASVTKVLESDLDLAGWFQLVPSAQASYIVGGSASGGSLEGKVTDGSGAVVLSKTYTGDDRSAAHQFADDIVETLTGNKGIATTKIAFVANGSGAKEIYLADYDGNASRRLTSDRSISVAPSLGPGARKLAYTGYHGGYPDVYVIDTASGARNRVVGAPGTNSGAAISPDGGRMALTMSKDGNPEIYITGINGGGARRLTRTRGVESSPAWSPDGGELIYSSDTGGGPQLYRIGAGGGRPARSPRDMATAPTRAGRRTAGKSRSPCARAAASRSPSWTLAAAVREWLPPGRTLCGGATRGTSYSAAVRASFSLTFQRARPQLSFPGWDP